MTNKHREILNIAGGIIGIELLFLPKSILSIVFPLICMYLIISSFYIWINGKTTRYLAVRFLSGLLMLLLSADVICQSKIAQYSQYRNIILVLTAVSLVGIAAALRRESRKDKVKPN